MNRPDWSEWILEKNAAHEQEELKKSDSCSFAKAGYSYDTEALANKFKLKPSEHVHDPSQMGTPEGRQAQFLSSLKHHNDSGGNVFGHLEAHPHVVEDPNDPGEPMQVRDRSVVLYTNHSGAPNVPGMYGKVVRNHYDPSRGRGHIVVDHNQPHGDDHPMAHTPMEDVPVTE